MAEETDQKGRDVVVIDLMCTLVLVIVIVFGRCSRYLGAIDQKSGVLGRVENVGEGRHRGFRSWRLGIDFHGHVSSVEMQVE